MPRNKGEGTIVKRKDGTYEGKISLGTVVRDGKTVRVRKSVYGATPQEIVEKLATLRVESGLGYTDAGTMTVGEYLQRWIKDTVRPNRRYKTIRSYEDTVNNHIAPVLGALKLVDIKAAHLKAFRRRLTELKTRPHTAWYSCGVLKNAIRTAAADGLIPFNPFSEVRLDRPPKRKMTPWTIEDARKFFDAADETDRLHAFWVLAVSCGLRHGEMLALRWEDVDLKGRLMHVRRNLEEHEKGAFELTPVKTEESEATISIPEDTAAALIKHRERLLAEGIRSEFVFVTPERKPYFRARIREAFLEAIAKAEVPVIRVHDLRHTCATLLLEAGLTLKDIQALLRHKDFNLTANTYAHATAKTRANTAAKMNSLLRGDT